MVYGCDLLTKVGEDRRRQTFRTGVLVPIWVFKRIEWCIFNRNISYRNCREELEARRDPSDSHHECAVTELAR